MAQESPLCSTEEWVRFDIRGTGTGSKSTHLVFDEEFSNERFAKTNRYQ